MAQTARQRNTRLAEAREQRAQREYRGTHGLDQLVGRLGVVQWPGMDADRAVVVALGADTMLRTSFSIVDTSCRRGTLCSVTGSSVSSAAHSSGSAAFLAPDISTSPLRLAPAANQQFVHQESSDWVACEAEFFCYSCAGPFGRRIGLHRECMHLVRVHFRTEGGVDPLMPPDRALAFEFRRDDGGVPMAAIAFQRDVFARQPGGNDGFEFFGSHG